jgi:hypothetical protein
MKKLIVALAFILITLIALTGSASKMTNALTANSWKFKSVASEDVSASHYVGTIYEGAQYRFTDDNNFTGSFFELSVSGTWNVSNDTLYLNKSTSREEIYTYTISPENALILKATERGSKVLLNFVKE